MKVLEDKNKHSLPTDGNENENDYYQVSDYETENSRLINYSFDQINTGHVIESRSILVTIATRLFMAGSNGMSNRDGIDFMGT
jgi:hypothetical protein